MIHPPLIHLNYPSITKNSISHYQNTHHQDLHTFHRRSGGPLKAAWPSNSTVTPAAASLFWAMSCNDTKCSQNSGQSVKVSNPGHIG
ncbi:hypothetical protein HD806DRAFT_479865 [Xylariaceae sp. AK1471]|nr:hypothetical protein HD806DRAFT_479865 [Xylariaceae sp. AK1471]